MKNINLDKVMVFLDDKTIEGSFVVIPNIGNEFIFLERIFFSYDCEKKEFIKIKRANKNTDEKFLKEILRQKEIKELIEDFSKIKKEKWGDITKGKIDYVYHHDKIILLNEEKKVKFLSYLNGDFKIYLRRKVESEEYLINVSNFLETKEEIKEIIERKTKLKKLLL